MTSGPPSWINEQQHLFWKGYTIPDKIEFEETLKNGVDHKNFHNNGGRKNVRNNSKKQLNDITAWPTLPPVPLRTRHKVEKKKGSILARVFDNRIGFLLFRILSRATRDFGYRCCCRTSGKNGPDARACLHLNYGPLPPRARAHTHILLCMTLWVAYHLHSGN